MQSLVDFTLANLGLLEPAEAVRSERSLDGLSLIEIPDDLAMISSVITLPLPLPSLWMTWNQVSCQDNIR